MRKIVALLLALSMVLSLCACGASQDEAGAKEAEQNPAIAVMPRKITVIPAENFQVCTIDLPDEPDYLEITNPKLTKVNGSIYRLSFDAKCLFPEDLGVEYPNLIIIHHNYADKNATALRSAESKVYSFIYGQNFTMDATVHTEAYLMESYLVDISEVESIVFTSYEMKNSTAAERWVGDWQFVKPIEFKIADLLPEEEIKAAREWAEQGIDPIQAEIVKTESGEEKLRIVNSGDKKQEYIIVEYQQLDKDGDVAGTGAAHVRDLEAGQGTKESLFKGSDVCAIKITQYTYPHPDGSGYITSVEERFSMRNPIILELD